MFEMSRGDTNDKMMLLFENKRERGGGRERERLGGCASGGGRIKTEEVISDNRQREKKSSSEAILTIQGWNGSHHRNRGQLRGCGKWVQVIEGCILSHIKARFLYITFVVPYLPLFTGLQASRVSHPSRFFKILCPLCEGVVTRIRTQFSSYNGFRVASEPASLRPVICTSKNERLRYIRHLNVMRQKGNRCFCSGPRMSQARRRSPRLTQI